MGELKRAQEMRTDEFSRNELRERHATFQELTSQVQELQERMNFRRIAVENYFTQVLELFRVATKACDQIHGI